MRPSLIACAFCVTAFAAAQAHAFCRTTTVAIDPSFEPAPGMCWGEGLPLYWANACVGYSINESASRQISLDDAQNGMETALAQWTNATCVAEAMTSKASVDVRYLGPVACHKVEYNQSGGNANVIMFDDDSWPYSDANNTLGLTTVTYNTTTGELYDADMEINTAQQTLTVNGPLPANGFDFLSIITHESGHFLGMAHSADMQATMFAHYTQGTTSLRNLSADDIAGICTIYPPDGTRTTAAGPLTEGPCDPTPMGGYSGTCGGGGGGCSLAAPPGERPNGSGSSLAALVIAAMSLGMRARKRAARRGLGATENA